MIETFLIEVWPKIEKLMSIPMMLVCGYLAIANAVLGRYAWAVGMAMCFIWWTFTTYMHFIKPRLKD